MIHRFLPTRESEFVLETIPSVGGHPVFEISAKGHKVLLRGSDSVCQASAFNWYLKHVANCQISTRGDQLRLPRSLPLPSHTIRKVSPYTRTNFLNYCTFCYTSAFWSWKEWEREIDILAMSGVRNPLMAVGTEKVWQNVLRKLGYSQQDIASFIPSRAFTAWWLMGNLEGEGGPVPQKLIEGESIMAKRILARMRSFGMEPILQGFCGIVPTTMPKYLPHARILDQGKWAGGYQRPSVLSPLDSAFPAVAQLWYTEEAKLYGKAKFYGGDLFHEGGRSAGLDLAACAHSVQHEMQAKNPGATWVLQGWSGNPPKALLDGTDPAHTLVEYLQSYPGKFNPNNFSGRPWSYTMVYCFGGHESLGGSLPAIASIPSTLLKQDNHHNVGLGILDEGLDANPAVYDLESDMVWQQEDVSVDKWATEYATRRYGGKRTSAARAWQLLANDLLGHESENLLCARPRFGIQSTSTWGYATLKHDLSTMLRATELLLESGPEFRNALTYQCDCIDMVRQMFNDCGVQLYEQICSAYARKDIPEFEKLSKQFLQLMADDDRLLASGPYSLVGTWLADARARGTNHAESDFMERSARQLITLWTPKETDLSDYAFRNWSGLTRDYYVPRWQNFFHNLSVALHSGKAKPEFTDVAGELRWAQTTDSKYSVVPSGNGFDVASGLFRKYRPLFEQGIAYWGAQKAEEKRFKWTLANSTSPEQTLSWDVTQKLGQLGPGNFAVRIQYEKGNNAIKLSGIVLVEKTSMAVNGVVIAQDLHPGRSGVETKDNVYHFNLPTLSSHSQYLLQARASGDGGNDSSGRITVEKL